MNIIKYFPIAVCFLFISCNKTLTVTIKPDYYGWITILEANDKDLNVAEYVFPDEYGIIYLNKNLFNSIGSISINDGSNKKIELEKARIYKGEYYSSEPGKGSSNKVNFINFHYPLNDVNSGPY